MSLILRDQVLATQLVSPGSSEAVFYLSPEQIQASIAGLRVRVVDASTGDPVSDASMSAYCDTFITGLRTDEDGKAEFTALEPGPCTLLVQVPGLGLYREQLLLEPGTSAEIEVRLGASTTIQGRVVDLQGRAVGNPDAETDPISEEAPCVLIARLDPATGAAEWDDLRYTVDAQGEIKLPVSRDLLLLRAIGTRWASDIVQVDARQGSIDGIEIVVHPPVRVALQLASGSWKGCRYQVVDENGNETEQGWFRAPAPHSLDVAPGTYRLVVAGASGVPLFETIFVAKSAPVIVPIRL